MTNLGYTKQVSRAINYAEKRAVEKCGHNCDINYAKSNFKELRVLYGKDTGIQAHTVIQSFKPGEVTAEKANQMGLELAQSIAKEYQVAIYTHGDTEHIHNHIVINSVNLENGKKYQSNRKQIDLVKSENDRICREHEVSVVKEKSPVRYTLAEKTLLEKGQTSWKDELRKAIDQTKERTSDFKSFRETLKEFDIEVKLRGQTISYKHPEVNKWVRGRKLGHDYEKGGLENGFERQIESRNQSNSTTFDWNEYKRRNQLQGKNDRNREAERADRATDRPISNKYRTEQLISERQNNERVGNLKGESSQINRQSRGFTRDREDIER